LSIFIEIEVVVYKSSYNFLAANIYAQIQVRLKTNIRSLIIWIHYLREKNITLMGGRFSRVYPINLKRHIYVPVLYFSPKHTNLALYFILYAPEQSTCNKGLGVPVQPELKKPTLLNIRAASRDHGPLE